MPKPSATSQLDGVSAISAGMNSGVSPRLIGPQALAFAINVTNRGGLPRTRPAYRKVALAYESNEVRANAQQALFQGAAFYRAIGAGENCLVASIGGRLFRYLVGTSGAVTDISIAADLNDPFNPNAWMWQAEDFLIVQNGAANPLFFDGASTTRSLGLGGAQLPPGCMGAYVQGRNWMALPAAVGTPVPGNSFMAGDLVYSHGFQDGYDGRKAVLATEENTFFSGGGAFGVPLTAGPITAMTSVAIPDTSLGQGPLQVMTSGSVFSVQVPLLREEWANATYPLVTIGLPNYGASGQLAVSVVNGDLWYRAPDGIRSYQIARRDFNTWVNTPLSVEVEAILRLDTPRWLGKASSLVFDNRLLMTCSPALVRTRGVAWRGIVALDFNNISNLTTRSQPAYDGLWTGLNVLQLVKGTFNGVERCFAFALDCTQRIVLYEILTDGAAYFDYNGRSLVNIESSFDTRSLGFNDNGNKLKRLQCADLYLDRLGGAPAATSDDDPDGTMRFAFSYRSDEDPLYQAWHSFTLCAPITDCAPTLCPVFTPVQPQYRTFLRLPDPRDVCSPITKRMTRTGYEFQIRMRVAGYFQLNRLHVWADPSVSDSVVQSCPTSETCHLVKGCEGSWFTYSIEGCVDETIAGLVWEDTSIWITTEGGEIIRAEDQPQTGVIPPPPVTPPPATGACIVGSACTIMSEADCLAAGGTYGGDGSACTPVTPPYTLPAWPPPPAYGCDGETYSSEISMEDPMTLVTRPVGINPGALSPEDYLLQFYTADQTSAIINGWCAQVWSEFLASNTPFSQARLQWRYIHVSSGPGTGEYPANAVFPYPNAGGWATVVDLDLKLVVLYCPAP